MNIGDTAVEACLSISFGEQADIPEFLAKDCISRFVWSHGEGKWKKHTVNEEKNCLRLGAILGGSNLSIQHSNFFYLSSRSSFMDLAGKAAVTVSLSCWSRIRKIATNFNAMPVGIFISSMS